MKRYFFDLSDGGSEPDTVGTVLENDATAQREAIRFAGEILKSEPDRLDHGSMRVDVHDESASARFSIEIALKGGEPASAA